MDCLEPVRRKIILADVLGMPAEGQKQPLPAAPSVLSVWCNNLLSVRVALCAGAGHRHGF